MEWEAPGIVLRTSPFGEGDQVATVLTEEHGAHRGLVRGGASSRQRGLWETGNVVRLRWVGRTAAQLGAFRGELVSSPAARLMDDPLRLAAASASCAVADGALPERTGHAQTYQALLLLLAELVNGEPCVPAFVRWELALLQDLGFGLDLARCAAGGNGELAYVSPRTGRAVSRAAGTAWHERLLRLPPFLSEERAAAGDEGSVADLLDGLRLTGHFLERDAFGHRHVAVPAARSRFEDLVARSGRSRDPAASAQV